MNLIICIDENNGYSFFNRRQSKDCLLRERILSLTEGHSLWMNEYSARQFENVENIIVDNYYLSKAGNGDYCFVEINDISLENTEKIILYKWNRSYPSDKFFAFDLTAEGFTLDSACDFSGNSHENITEEIYVKKQM